MPETALPQTDNFTDRLRAAAQATHGVMDAEMVQRFMQLADGIDFFTDRARRERASEDHTQQTSTDDVVDAHVAPAAEDLVDREHLQRVQHIAARVTYRDNYRVHVDHFDSGDVYVQVKCHRPDANTGEMGWGSGGKARISVWASESEVVQTIFGLLKAYEEHECREAFRYDGARVFGPHIDVRALAEVSERTVYRGATAPPEEPETTGVDMSSLAVVSALRDATTDLVRGYRADLIYGAIALKDASVLNSDTGLPHTYSSAARAAMRNAQMGLDVLDRRMTESTNPTGYGRAHVSRALSEAIAAIEKVLG